MALQFEHSFVVKAPKPRVWEYLTDPFRVAPALPGAAITEKIDDQTYAGTITVKVGPVSARYKGKVRFESLDPVAGTADIVASGQDVSGRGGADMKMQSRITERPGGESEVSVASEVSVTGIMAQFGRGLMQDVSNQMFERFTEAMRAELEKPVAAAPGVCRPRRWPRRGPARPVPAPSPASAPPLEVSSFVLRRPGFWILVLVIIAFVYWLWIR
jgi:carbon monoxide dehydrogenase subunit G